MQKTTIQFFYFSFLASRMVEGPDAVLLLAEFDESLSGTSQERDGKSQQKRTRQNRVSGITISITIDNEFVFYKA